MKLLPEDLDFVAETAAQRVHDQRAAHTGGPLWDAAPAGVRNEARGQAYPLVIHALDAYEELRGVPAVVEAAPEELLTRVRWSGPASEAHKQDAATVRIQCVCGYRPEETYSGPSMAAKLASHIQHGDRL